MTVTKERIGTRIIMKDSEKKNVMTVSGINKNLNAENAMMFANGVEMLMTKNFSYLFVETIDELVKEED